MSLNIDNVHFLPRTPNRPFNGQSSNLEEWIVLDLTDWIELKASVGCSSQLKILSRAILGSRIKRISGQYIAQYATIGEGDQQLGPILES
jgi:hypothetical protein